MYVQSLGALVTVGEQWAPASGYGALQMYDRYFYDYAAMYRMQPNVRTCVDFLARNIAQLGIHVFRRLSETDRERLRDHPLAMLLSRPLPHEYKVTAYRFIESMMGDLGIYLNNIHLKVRPDGETTRGLLRIPPPLVTIQGGLVPRMYEVNLAGRVLRFEPEQILHIRGYNADSAIWGLSPLETLRRVLAEEHAAGAYREHFWANSARMNGIIERPADAADWSPAARERFKSEFEALYSGVENSGRTAILEDGMTWKASAFSARDSEYLAGRKLTREECARAYHIPLPMVGILEHATFSNVKEQHKHLYQDCLGPWLAMIEQDIQTQLLPDFADSDGVYVEFNIAEKLQGSFDEQTTALQSAVGRPWMTADEARARMNLPSMGGDAEELVTPLNVLVGGQASPRDSAPPRGERALKALTPGTKAAELDPTLERTRETHEARWLDVVRAHFRRQERAIIGRVPEGTPPEKAVKTEVADLWDEARWDREFAQDLFRLNVATATVWARYVMDQLEDELDEDVMLDWLSENARIAAEQINATTKDQVADALLDPAPRSAVRRVFEIAIAVRAVQIATSRVTTAANFGAQEGARQGGLRSKTWQVNSSNPRDEHALMDGETVGIGDLFSNGMRWPGDPAGGAENNANCKCSVRFGRGDEA